MYYVNELFSTTFLNRFNSKTSINKGLGNFYDTGFHNLIHSMVLYLLKLLKYTKNLRCFINF